MSSMKKIYIAPALLTTILSLNMSFAQAETNVNTQVQTTAETTKKTPPYGDNPNIFKVFAYKTTDKVVDTAEKVGDATERGIDKIKPKVDETWDKVTGKHTVDVPIENKTLSQSSNNEPAPKVVAAAPLTPANTVSSVAEKKLTDVNVTEPTQRAEPIKPIAPVKPTEPVKPAEPADSKPPKPVHSNQHNPTILL